MMMDADTSLESTVLNFSLDLRAQKCHIPEPEVEIVIHLQNKEGKSDLISTIKRGLATGTSDEEQSILLKLRLLMHYGKPY